MALQCLRSCIENICFCEYYRDHPVELKLWNKGRHQLGFSGMVTYFQKHPDVESIQSNLTGLDIMQKEYSILSRAVHSSSPSFRMTVAHGNTKLWTSENKQLKAWSTRELQTMIGINLFLIVMHSDKLQRAKLPGLRQSISLTIKTRSRRNAILSRVGVNLQLSS